MGVMQALTDDEVRRFERALAVAAKESVIGRRDQVLFTLLLKSGMRLTAALAIDVEDLNLAECSLVSCGKHGRIQGVFLPRRVAQMLRRHIREQGGGTGGAVFRSSQGRRRLALPKPKPTRPPNHLTRPVVAPPQNQMSHYYDLCKLSVGDYDRGWLPSHQGGGPYFSSVVGAGCPFSCGGRLARGGGHEHTSHV
jgi:hypothetical protein